MPGTWRHLTARFFRVTLAEALTSEERRLVHDLLGPEERAMFDSQPHIDQRHGLEAMQAVRTTVTGRRDLERTALLHDVGKRHSELGVVGRVAATLAAKLHLPARGRFRLYLDHGPVAAAELQAAGAESIVVEFARDHHGARPPSIAADDWEVLQAADR